MKRHPPASEIGDISLIPSHLHVAISLYEDLDECPFQEII